MQLELSSKDRAFLAGEEGPAAKMAMSILVRMANVFRVERLMDISAAHVDSPIYMGIATMEYAERLADLGARVRVPSTLNVSGVDEHGWQEWSVPAQIAENAGRQMAAYSKMGCIPTWTCAPYQTEHRPSFGQQIASGESNAICFFNSVIGARTERYPDLLDICAAITARVPARGLHLSENRKGTLLVDLQGIPDSLQDHDAFYPVLGHLLGKLDPDGIPVIAGLNAQLTDDRHKAICAGAASSGAIALYHVVGQTPEAQTLAEAFHNSAPPKTVRITMPDIRVAYGELSTSRGDQLQMVVLGSPHFSLNEFKVLAPLLRGKQCHPDVTFLVTCSRAVRMIAGELGYVEPLASFGGRITVDTCPLASPMLPDHIRSIMTNSAKYAYYTPGLLNADVAFGTLEDCVQSAVAGRIERDESIWHV
jgi:predicted aconitase